MLADPKSDFGKGFAAGVKFAVALDDFLNGSFRHGPKRGDVCRTEKAKAAAEDAESLLVKLMEAERDAR
jgi:hypothetical protein